LDWTQIITIYKGPLTTLIVMQYMSQMTTDMFCLSKSQSCRVPLVKQELLTLPKHQSSLLIF